MIDDFIEMAKHTNRSSTGANKKCYVFGEYVLLCYNGYVDLNDEIAPKKVAIMQLLMQRGVNIAALIDYKKVDGISYELQLRAPGEELYDYDLYSSDENGHKKYLERLRSISSEGPEFYDKFVHDWNEILNSGLNIDPSKTGNFFYTPGKICFIDLNMRTMPLEKRKEYIYMEMSTVLRGGGLPWMCTSVSKEAVELIKTIYIKLGEAIIRAHGDIEAYIMQTDKYNDLGLSDYFQDYIKSTSRTI